MVTELRLYEYMNRRECGRPTFGNKSILIAISYTALLKCTQPLHNILSQVPSLLVPQPAQPLCLHNVLPGDYDATESLTHETAF